MVNIEGTIIGIGQLRTEDMEQRLDEPSIMLRLEDGRIVVLAGLTRDECRACASAFDSHVTVSVARAAGGFRLPLQSDQAAEQAARIVEADEDRKRDTAG